MSKKVNKLKPRIGEISLVPRGKQGLPFLFTKEARMDWEQLLKAVAETELENEEQLDEFLEKQKVPDAAKNAAKGALRMFASAKESLPPEVMKTLVSMAGYGYPPPTAKQVEPGDDPKDEPKDPPADDPKDVSKGGHVPDPRLALKEDGTIDLEQVPEEVRPLVAHLTKEQKVNDGKVVDLTERLAKEERLRKQRDFEDRISKELGALAGDREEIAQTLLEAHAVSEEFGEKLWKQLEKQNAALKENDHLTKELGRAGGDSSEGMEGHEKLLAIAKEIQTANPELTKEQAYEKAFDMHPEHYEQFSKEKQARERGLAEVN